MSDKASIFERLGFRRANGVGEAGWGHTLFVAVIAFVYFLPVLFIIFTAIKPQEFALSVPPTISPTSLFGLIPEQYVFTPTLDNFGSVFERSMTVGGAPEPTGFDRYFFNSIFISSVSVLLALVIGTLAAFGFSRFPLRAAGLSGSYVGIILLYTAFNLAFTIWMMKSFFDELSLDVEDAARIDGSSGMKVFFKISLPQVVAGLAATFVFGLILTWNEFLFALLLSGTDTRTVPVAMNQAVSSGGRGTDWTLLAAIETLFLIPVFLVTFFLQDHLLRGVTFGTVKR
jgi:multiple sugar transport system permease protein